MMLACTENKVMVKIDRSINILEKVYQKSICLVKCDFKKFTEDKVSERRESKLKKLSFRLQRHLWRLKQWNKELNWSHHWDWRDFELDSSHQSELEEVEHRSDKHESTKGKSDYDQPNEMIARLEQLVGEFKSRNDQFMKHILERERGVLEGNETLCNDDVDLEKDNDLSPSECAHDRLDFEPDLSHQQSELEEVEHSEKELTDDFSEFYAFMSQLESDVEEEEEEHSEEYESYGRQEVLHIEKYRSKRFVEVFKLDEPTESTNVNEDILKELKYLSNKFKNVQINKYKISENDEKDFQRMSEILINSLPDLDDPHPDFDKILYKDGTLQNEPEKEYLIDAKDLFANIDAHTFCHVYSHMVHDKNIMNQYFDNAFLKLVEHKEKTWTWSLDRLLLDFLDSKIIYHTCIGLKIFKTYLKADGFKYYVTRDLCSAVSDFSKIPAMINSDENEMTKFVARHAKDCHDLIKEKGKLTAYRARDIFMEVTDGIVIDQCQVRALYEIIKSDRSIEKLYQDLQVHGLRITIKAVVHLFLYYIRRSYKKYEELDEEMREIDKQNGREFGGFSLEVVADDDMKPICASDGLEKSTLNKYFYYDDAMKTLSVLSFLYNCVEKSGKDEQHFKVTNYVTQFVIILIHQYELNLKIDKPSWIMEKILNKCHFIVFGHDEEKEKDIFLKLLNGGEIDGELFYLKDFMKKNGLSYDDEGREYEYH